MSSPRRAALLIAHLLDVAVADLYMHHPRGSNNKLNEVSNQAQNQNRLFDSQNNAEGGYQVGDNCKPVCSNANGAYDSTAPGAGKGIMYFYEGSYLHVEWTNQHGCGATQPNVKCELILQYMCDEEHFELGNPDLRDGRTTATVPATAAGAADPQFGMHEPLAWYQNCLERERNKGLYTADQNLLGDRDRARFTRQNPAGTRRGLECPEERDYYPYWHPTPWRDIAVFTDDIGRCSYYREETQNEVDKGACCNRTLWEREGRCQQVPGYDPTGQDQTPPGPNNAAACTRFQAVDRGQYAGAWVLYGRWDAGRPQCLRTPVSRDNHLGNAAPWSAVGPAVTNAASFKWRVPPDVLRRQGTRDLVRDKATCVLRMRYNISTTDFDAWNIDAGKNGNPPVKNNPAGDFLGLTTDPALGTNFPLQLNMNTNQYGRTFEDRSHTFEIRARPKEMACKDRVIHNLNVRGRRGNIVQVYPAVEYDFVPNQLELWEGECIHFQWTGSDANPPGNAGNGRQMTDRTNIVEIPSLGNNRPKKLGWREAAERIWAYPLWSNLCGNDEALCKKLAYLDQEKNVSTSLPSRVCNDEQTNENALDNCKELNAAPAYFDAGPVLMDYPGKLYYMSTRNNDFTNRSHKASIIIQPWRTALIIACVVVGILILWISLWYWVRKARYDPEHRLHAYRHGKHMVRFLDCCGALYLRSPLSWAPWTIALVCLCGVLYLVGWWFAGGPGAVLQDPAPWYVHAKACGRVLDVLCNLIFFPVLRNFISWLRTTPLAHVLPLGEEIYFHKAIAVLIAISGIGHIACHYADYVWHRDFGTGFSFGQQAFGTWSGFSGLLILICMVFMFVTALERVRRRKWGWGKYSFGGYSLFVRVHKLWVVVLVLLWTHSQTFWHYSLAPTALLILDKLIGRLRGKVPVRLLEASSPTRDVITLKLQLMTNRKFRYKAGQYLFLHCPAISKTEWHPFTISSSPEERFFSVHIRCRPDMDWTYALKTALLPDAKMRAAQAAAREKLRQQQELDVKVATQKAAEAEAKTAAGKFAAKSTATAGGRSGKFFPSANLDGVPSRPTVLSHPSGDEAGLGGIGAFFQEHFGWFGGGGASSGAGGGDGGGGGGGAGGGGGELAEKSAARKMYQSAKHLVSNSDVRSHRQGDNSSRDGPPKRLRARSPSALERLWKGRGPQQMPEPVKLPSSRTAARAVAVPKDKARDGGGPSKSAPPSPPPSPPEKKDTALEKGSAEEKACFLNADGEAVELFVDGPYGTASEEVFGYEVLVLVGAGIGVTPFASILKTLALQAQQGRLETPLKKVAFYWICRDDKEFESFRDLLVGIVTNQALAGIFELNTYITGEVDLKKIVEEKKLYAYNQFAGKPEWNRIGKALRETYPNSDVGVFLCGPGAIGDQLNAMCTKFNPPKRDLLQAAKTGGKRAPRFFFHKENF
jgi:predicted ferric reductase